MYEELGVQLPVSLFPRLEKCNESRLEDEDPNAHRLSLVHASTDFLKGLHRIDDCAFRDMDRNGQTSPFFNRRKRQRTNGQDVFSRSKFFSTSECSACGATKAFGSFIYSLVEKIPKECCNCDTLLESCSLCTSLLRSASLHFRNCTIFQERWETMEMQGSSARSNEEMLDHCVRHICQNGCFLRAFAPCREWLALCCAVRETVDHPVHQLLSGWRCVLVVDKKRRARTRFLSPVGEIFETRSKALESLRMHEKIVRVTLFQCPGQSSPVWGTLNFTGLSPFGFLEELFYDDTWRLLLSTILLNRTRRIQVDCILFQILEKWPTPEQMSCACLNQLELILQPIGIHHRRARGIIRFSRDYLSLISDKKSVTSAGKCEVTIRLSRDEILGLPNCGEYAYGAYRLFILQDFNFEPDDHALKLYAELQRARYS